MGMSTFFSLKKEVLFQLDHKQLREVNTAVDGATQQKNRKTVLLIQL